MKIVFLDESTIGNIPMEDIKALGEYIGYSSSTKEQTLLRVKDCDVLLVNKVIVDEDVLDAAPNLKLICVLATGTNNINHIACQKRGIIVRNVAAYSTDSVVQTTFTLLLSLIGRSYYFDNYVKNGDYSRSGIFTNPNIQVTELANKTMGIIGMGNIGTKVASVATAFGMRVIYFSTSGTSHNTTYPSVSLNELMQQSDIVSIHCSLNEKTKGLVGEKELSQMKQSAIILNLGRGGIIDEYALIEAVESGKIKGAALDVFEQEPLPLNHPFLHLKHPEHFCFSPHIAWACKESIQRLISMTAENIRKGF